MNEIQTYLLEPREEKLESGDSKLVGTGKINGKYCPIKSTQRREPLTKGAGRNH